MHDPLGDACKALERACEAAPLDPRHWLVARLDGRGFSKRTRGLTKPFDPRLAGAMEAVARHLMGEFHPLLAYHQSDEISLFWHPLEGLESRPFGTRRSKWLSVLPAAATAALVRALDAHGLSTMADGLPHMDARLISAPTIQEAGMLLAWRAQDARRNAIQGAAQIHYSQPQLARQSTATMQEMLRTAGVEFQAFPDAYRNGTRFFYQSHERPHTDAELAAWPAHIRPDPAARVVRRALVGDCATLPADPTWAAAHLETLTQQARHHRLLRSRATTP